MCIFSSSQFLTSRYADQILYILLDKLVAKHWIFSLDTEQRNSLSSPPRGKPSVSCCTNAVAITKVLSDLATLARENPGVLKQPWAALEKMCEKRLVCFRPAPAYRRQNHLRSAWGNTGQSCQEEQTIGEDSLGLKSWVERQKWWLDEVKVKGEIGREVPVFHLSDFLKAHGSTLHRTHQQNPATYS